MVTFSDGHGNGTSGSRTIVAAANDRLHNNSDIPAQQVSCEYEQGVLLLRGRLATYFRNKWPRKQLKDWMV